MQRFWCLFSQFLNRDCNLSRSGIFSLMVGLLGLFSSAFAQARVGPSRMPFAISGQRVPRPQWQDQTGREISALNFEFRAIAQPESQAHVDSRILRVRLKQADAYPVSAYLNLPSDCVVGFKSVPQEHVRLLTDATGHLQEHTDGPLQIMGEGLSSYGIRFVDLAKLGKDSGIVSCQKNGSLTFSY